jgi:hypothetical protein
MKRLSQELIVGRLVGRGTPLLVDFDISGGRNLPSESHTPETLIAVLPAMQ